MDNQVKSIAVSNEDLWRANIYGLLGNVLAKPPNQHLLEQITSMSVEREPNEGSPLQMAWRSLIEAAGNCRVDEIESEFHSLFIGITGGALKPYGSWYLSGFLMEKPLASLRSDLARLGFERIESVHEPEDHMAALCETMCLLIMEKNAGQDAFFKQHIHSWAEKFFNDLVRADGANFYKPIGSIGAAFVKVEAQLFSIASA